MLILFCPPSRTASSPKTTSASWSAQSNPLPSFSRPTKPRTTAAPAAQSGKFASTDNGLNPDVVIVAIGSELTFEVIAAAHLLKKRVPELRVRVVNVTDLMILAAESVHPHALKDDSFNSLFGEEVPVHFSYHGYATELKGLLFGRPNMHRVTIASYMEEGSTTTPFNMMLLNETSRFLVAIKAVEGGAKKNEKVRLKTHELVSELKNDAEEARKYIVEKKADPPSLSDVGEFNIDIGLLKRRLNGDEWRETSAGETMKVVFQGV